MDEQWPDEHDLLQRPVFYSYASKSIVFIFLLPTQPSLDIRRKKVAEEGPELLCKLQGEVFVFLKY